MAEATTPQMKLPSGLSHSAKRFVLWFASIVIVAALGAYAGHYFTRSDNLELALKQTQLSELQKFRASGAALDSSFRAFNDSLADKRNVEVARDAMRAAIAQHSADTMASQSLLGEKNVADYVKNLAALRDQVDKVTNPTNAMPMAQSALNLISARLQMAHDVEVQLGLVPAKAANPNTDQH